MSDAWVLSYKVKIINSMSSLALDVVLLYTCYSLGVAVTYSDYNIK